MRKIKETVKTASINLFLAIDAEEGALVIKRLENLKWVKNNKANFKFTLQPQNGFYYVTCTSDHEDFSEDVIQHKLMFTLLNSIVSSLR